jgi:Kdo2-lipid IVA lauroyltransferase/acyltransferase
MYHPDVPKYPIGFKILAWPWLYLISKVPFAILYKIADILTYLMQRIIKYREKVIMDNLRQSFPEKSEAEIRSIVSKYYAHLGDLFVEVIKGMSMTSSQLKERMPNLNLDVYREFYHKNQSFIVVMSHCGNWEWVCLMSQLTCEQQVFFTYKPLKNRGFNTLMYRIRSKFGAKPVSMNETLRAVVQNQKEVTLLALLGDQNPSNANQAYWSNSFLNRPTAFLTGPAKISKKFNLPIVYLSCHKIKRGYYEARSRVILSDPTEFTEDQISELVANQIEAEIKNQPEIWLWSHRRWKHKKPST